MPRPTVRYIRCFLCPAAYHPGDWCLPAGSKKITHNWIICPRHALDGSLFQDIPPPLHIPLPSSTLTTMLQPTNVSWCFICSKGGRIICCETCPASFHEECLKIDEVPDKFICEDCSSGRFPRYGEIVWSRLPPKLNVHHSNVTSDDKNGSVSNYISLTAGIYWWPGEIVHPRHLKSGSNVESSSAVDFEALDEISQRVSNQAENPLGLFPVRLFGLVAGHNNLPIIVWSTRARVFPYEEGDDKRGDNSSTDSSGDEDYDQSGKRRKRNSGPDDGEDEDPLLQLRSLSEKEPQSPPYEECSAITSTGTSIKSPRIPNLRSRSARRQHLAPHDTDQNLSSQRKAVYSAAVKQAAKGWLERREKFNQLLGRTRRPDYYKPIKVNWPLGSVRVYRISDSSEAPRCECIPNTDTDPCGPTSNCINRELHYECLPSVCPNGEACQNQRFTKRLYPAQQPFWTGEERGWGLKTLVPIRSGEFVNEYIGDLIDEEEANRRLRFAHENNVTNYYMMKLDSQRIIDAGPKGNLSRFMNHSCNPNLNTQKWTVNGDNRIGLFAIRDIVAGEELTFNYNFVALGQERLNCRCGASNCTGFLGASSSSISQSSTTGCGSHSIHRSSDDRSDSQKTLSNHTSDGVSKATSIVGGVSRGGTSESALCREDRHELTCFRCSAQLLPNSGNSPSFTNLFPKFSQTVESSEACDTGLHSSSLCTSETSLMIFCTKQDCTKAYHLTCVDLKDPPSGRWFCPWHHCDACGRPSCVFCSLCPSSFCLAHVEGSVTVLPPSEGKPNLRKTKSKIRTLSDRQDHAEMEESSRWKAALARIVCMSHHDLMENTSTCVSSNYHTQPQPLLTNKCQPALGLCSKEMNHRRSDSCAMLQVSRHVLS